MRIFISQPMAGRTNEEIESERNRIVEAAMQQYGYDVKVIDSFMQRIPADAKPLWLLGESIKLLSFADVAIFAPYWHDYRGCKIECKACMEYGITAVEYIEDPLYVDRFMPIKDCYFC